MNKKFSSPTVVQLEITDICNEKCRHCYNFWREKNSSQAFLTKDKLDLLVDMFVEAGVFHVILTGGEPFTHFELLKHGLKRLLDNNISISCNSNLTLATQDQLHQLRDIGLDHILTSLNSFDPATNDFIVNHIGAFDKIVRGIEMAISLGIRISANMIVSPMNASHVYDTGKLAHELGCQKFFGTRVVPSAHTQNPTGTDYHLTKEIVKHTLEQLLRVKNDTGIMIGTLVSYPLCLLGDLDLYKDFVGRGCPGQSGHLMSINASGETHACVHQEEGYGNIFDIGIYNAYSKLHKWHDGSLFNKECTECDYLNICRSGCRMTSLAYNGTMAGRDILMEKANNFVKPYKIVDDKSMVSKIEQGQRFTVPKRLRFRKEDGFYLVNIRWANTIICSTEVAELLIKFQAKQQQFDITDFSAGNKELLAKLYFKDAIECCNIKYCDGRDILGLSADIN